MRIIFAVLLLLSSGILKASSVIPNIQAPDLNPFLMDGVESGSFKYGFKVEVSMGERPASSQTPEKKSEYAGNGVLLYETTFDYRDECSGTGNGAGLPTACDSISGDKMLNWNDIDSKQAGFGNRYVTSAVLAANNPHGGGGLGARFWVNDGRNQGSVSNRIFFPQEKELWIRWYQRYERGFAWSGGANPHYDKSIYIFSSGPGGGKGFAILAEHQAGSFQVWTDTKQPLVPSKPRITWNDVFGVTSDGEFHLFELHIKTNSAIGVADGVVQMWIDETKVIEDMSFDLTTGSDNPSEALAGIGRLDFHSNQSAPANGRPMYVDYDDISIYTAAPNISVDGDPVIGRHSGDSR